MLDFAAETVGVRHLIDGVWLPQESRDREAADGALEALKLLCGLNPKDRQKRQEGQLRRRVRRPPPGGLRQGRARPARTSRKRSPSS